jgi:hypothetical protein
MINFSFGSYDGTALLFAASTPSEMAIGLSF